MRGYRDLDPEAVLHVSFLRGLRVLRVKLRRSDVDVGAAKCRSLDSLRSLGMTGAMPRSAIEISRYRTASRVDRLPSVGE